MAEENKYLTELLAEKDSLDPLFVHSMMLLIQEINRVRGVSDTKAKSPPPGQEANYNGSSGQEECGAMEGQEEAAIQPRRREFRRPPEYFENKLEKPIKLAEKVSVPVKQYPRFNFVGKLLGPKGNTFKRLQAHCGCKMSILGRGSMRDKEKEEELRISGDVKYDHLSEDLHVLIEVEAPPAQAHARLGEAIEQIKKFLVPDPNDDIRQEQMREIALLQGIDDPAVPATPTAGRGRGVPPPPPSPRVPIARGTHLVRGAIRGRGPGVPAPAPARVAYEHRPPAPGSGIPRHAAPAVEQYASVGYEAYDPAYEYDPAYAEGGETVYYDYSHAGGEPFESAAYPPTAARAPVSAASYKAPPPRPAKRVIREATYPY